MNSRTDKEFLRDLVALLKRHGPEPFLSLVVTLTDPQKRGELVKALNELGEVASKARARSRKKKSRKPSERERAERLLESVEQSEPRKGELVRQFYESLSSRQVLPTKRDLLESCSAVGIELPSSAERNRLLFPLLQRLGELSYEDVKTVVNRASSVTGCPERDYERLANAIMKGPSKQ
jgi:hypothetical protein